MKDLLIGNQEQEAGIVEDLDNLIKKTRETDFINPKKEAILSSLKSAKRKTERYEGYYESDKKRKKVLFRVLVVLVITGIVLMVDEAFLNLLPLWIMNSYGYILIVFAIIAMLFTQSTK